MTDKIPCGDCKYAVVDTDTATTIYMGKRRWTYRETYCNNPESDYYLAVLNMKEDGQRCEKIVWHGCEYGKRRKEVI